MKYRILLYLSLLFFVVLTVFEIVNTYGLFESNRNMVTNTDIGKWNVYINDAHSNVGNFTVNSINLIPTDNVRNGKLAPGTQGYFDIVVNPKDTSVSIRYDIIFDFSLLPSNFAIEKINEINGRNLIRTDENMYTRIISLNDIKNNIIDTVRVYVKWNNDELLNNEDSTIGMTVDNSINIPIEIVVSQYLGEMIEVYAKE